MRRGLFVAVLAVASLPGTIAAQELAARSSWSCAVHAGDVWCWGRWTDTDWTGVECGSPGPEAYTHGEYRRARRFAIPGEARRVSMGRTHACALNAAGRVFCWGMHMPRPPEAAPARGPRGRPGRRGGREPVSSPTEVPGLGEVVDVSSGGSFACAVRIDGTVGCWGQVSRWGASGPSGTGQAVRVVRGIQGARRVFAGSVSTCAVDANGAARCWGRLDAGQSTPLTSPRAMPELGAVREMLHASFARCALRTDGQVVCASTQPVIAAETIRGVSDAVALAGSLDSRLCALERSGQVRCWTYAESGAGFTRATQVRAPRAEALAVGATHMCARRRGGQVMCWGENGSWQLGDGSRDDRARPGRVRFR